MSENNDFEAQLFKTADRLRKSIDAASYKHVVLGLVFLKYISHSFEKKYNELQQEIKDGADPEDKDEYKGENIFWVPKMARFSYLHARSKLPSIGEDLDLAMDEIEKENPILKGILPKVYARQNLDNTTLGGLLDLIADMQLNEEADKNRDLFGRIFEYFLGQFASQEGKRGGQFYTPKSIVRLLVEMIEPYQGRVYDPCCGSSGMFVMSEKFISEHSGNPDSIIVYGQESNHTTYRLSRMNLAIRGIDSSQIKWNSEGSFLNDAHPDLKADYILANPPFNQSDWGQELLTDDARWQYGVPPSGNANFAWMQHMIYHLAPNGIMGLVLANGSLSSNTSGEGEIRRKIVEADLVDCIVALPKQLFFNTGIPASLWFISRKKSGNGDRKRAGEVLFIDASELGRLEDRVHKVFDPKDIEKISSTYHEWRKEDGNYKDITGFCKSAMLSEIEKNGFVLTPGRFVGIPEEIDDGIPFEEKMTKLTNILKEQFAKEQVLNEEIKKQLGNIGFNL